MASGSMKNVVCEGVNPTRYKHVGWGASGAPRGPAELRICLLYHSRAAFENFQKRNQPHLLQTEIDMIGCLAVIVLC